MQQLEDATRPEPALKQLQASTSRTKPKSNTKTKDYFLIGETILIIGLLSVGLFCYTTSLTSDKADKADKAQLEDATNGKAQFESIQPEVKRSKKAQLVETQSKEDNIFDR